MTYDPYSTPHTEAAAMCGLTLRHWPGDHDAAIAKCELHDAAGNVVFAGLRWPDSWQFMEQQYGLTPNVELPQDWYK